MNSDLIGLEFEGEGGEILTVTGNAPGDGAYVNVEGDKGLRSCRVAAQLRRARDLAPVPDFEECGRCGAPASECYWDAADGWCCPSCGGSDADE